MNPADRIELGLDHLLTWFEYDGDSHAGVTVQHKTPDGSDCVGWCAIEHGAWAKLFKTPIATWKIEQVEPLTISPSLLCQACGDHGYIRDGKWVPA